MIVRERKIRRIIKIKKKCEKVKCLSDRRRVENRTLEEGRERENEVNRVKVRKARANASW